MAEHAEPSRKGKPAGAADAKATAERAAEKDGYGTLLNARAEPDLAEHRRMLGTRAAAGPQPIQPASTAPAPNRTGLPDRLKAGVEALSGLSMDDVRVHRNSSEPAKLGALAYATGAAIHLAPGQEQHLPHEAWHVVQQKQRRVKASPRLSGISINDDPSLEDEASGMGARAAAITSRFDDPPAPELRRSESRPVLQRVIQDPVGGLSLAQAILKGISAEQDENIRHDVETLDSTDGVVKVQSYADLRRGIIEGRFDKFLTQRGIFREAWAAEIEARRGELKTNSQVERFFKGDAHGKALWENSVDELIDLYLKDPFADDSDHGRSNAHRDLAAAWRFKVVELDGGNHLKIVPSMPASIWHELQEVLDAKTIYRNHGVKLWPGGVGHPNMPEAKPDYFLAPPGVEGVPFGTPVGDAINLTGPTTSQAIGHLWKHVTSKLDATASRIDDPAEEKGSSRPKAKADRGPPLTVVIGAHAHPDILEPAHVAGMRAVFRNPPARLQRVIVVAGNQSAIVYP
jgi:hypothetical protein